MGIKESNEVELLSIQRAMSLAFDEGGDKLVIESNSSNAIKWAKGMKRPPWRLITLVREIRDLVVGLEVSFVHISRISFQKMEWKGRPAAFSNYLEDSGFSVWGVGSYCLCILIFVGLFFYGGLILLGFCFLLPLYFLL